MEIRVTSIESNYEILHYFSKNIVIKSKANHILINYDGLIKRVHVPLNSIMKLFANIRLFRRSLRLDKSIYFPIIDKNQLLAIVGVYQGIIYKISPDDWSLKAVGKFEQGRVPLHQSVCRSVSGYVYMGEYSSNKSNSSVPIWRSVDNGNSWEVIHRVEREFCRHVHGCFWDKYESKIWVCTGDLNEEAGIFKADEEFREIEVVGRGSQIYRTCHVIFREDYVYWGMDSPIDDSYVIRYDRKKKTVKKVFKARGPIWYGKELEDGWMIFASSIEGGKSEVGREAVIIGTKDSENFYELFKKKKDFLPYLFKFGVIAFSYGKQDSSNFGFFAEGLTEIDGKISICEIIEK